MKRTDIINREIQKNNYSSYLEIGVSSGDNLRKVRCGYKVGVDPDPKSKGTTYYLTSDDFFKQNKEKFDIVFIDGLHEYEQVAKDIDNSIACLNEGGTIVLHDLNPHSDIIQRVPRESAEWTGDCWKAMLDYRLQFKSLAFTIDTDYGVGIIKPDQTPFKEEIEGGEYTWENLIKYRVEWLGLIRVKDYLKI